MFVDTASAASVTYTYQAAQRYISIANRGNENLLVSVGNYADVAIIPGGKWEQDVTFNSFSIRSLSGIQHFEAQAKQLSRRPSVVDIMDYKHLAVDIDLPTEDWSAAIQKAVDDVSQKIVSGNYESNIQGKVTFPIRRFKIRKPVLLPPQGVVIEGESASAIVLDNQYSWNYANVPCTIIEKTTGNTLGAKSRLMRSGAKTDNMDVDACFIVDHMNNQYNWNTVIKNIAMRYLPAFSRNTYAVFAPRSTHLHIENVQTYNFAFGFYTNDSWMTTITNFKVRDCISALKYESDGGGGCGTSLTATNVWANGCEVGFDISTLSYSTFNSCCAEHVKTNTIRAYSFVNCDGISLNGCGSEDIQGGDVIYMNNSQVVFNGFKTYSVAGAASGTRSQVNIGNGCNVIFNACRFWDYNAGVVAASNLIYSILANSNVKFSLCKFPANAGAAAIGAGSTVIIEDNAGITIKNSSTSRTL
ncbi:hypothetical protein [Brevibacillus centrosporus]|uniref:hypothetical protein n=1 Tax=Brevibacillus centrosporus TaxID=54910 RepID=UPI002E1AC6A4|nr:hypothetical protein [Brevibacillus centrosporus]